MTRPNSRRESLSDSLPRPGDELRLGNWLAGLFAFSVLAVANSRECVFNFAQSLGAIHGECVREFTVIKFSGEILGMNTRRLHCIERFTHAIARAGEQVIPQSEQGPVMPPPFCRDFILRRGAMSGSSTGSLTMEFHDNDVLFSHARIRRSRFSPLRK